MLKTRILKFALAACTAVSAVGLTGAVPAYASTPDAWLVVSNSPGCYLYTPGHNVSMEVECNSTDRETFHDINGFGWYDPVTNSIRTAYEIEITSGPADGLCLNNDPDNLAVSADSCVATGIDSDEYFWVDDTSVADTHWYRNVGETDNYDDFYIYLTDVTACSDGQAASGNIVGDDLGGCGGFGAWTAVTS